MIKLLKHVLLFFTIAFLNLACDRIKETPEPDSFIGMKLAEIEKSTDSSGVLYLNVVQENHIKSEVKVSFSTPRLGTISPDLANNRFIYRAFDEALGIDSFDYTVARGEDSKTGKIKLDVRTRPCIPTFNIENYYSVDSLIGDTLFFIPFDSRDKYCQLKTVTFIQDGPFQLFSLKKYDKYGMYVKARGIIFRGRRYKINYQVAHIGFPSVSKKIEFTFSNTNSFCDNIFRVLNHTHPYNVSSPTGFHQVNRDLLGAFVIVCPGDLIKPEDWFIGDGLNIEYTNPPYNTIVRIRKGSESVVKYGYRFVNKRTLKADTGWATVVFP